jgi:hypothetical protein
MEEGDWPKTAMDKAATGVPSAEAAKIASKVATGPEMKMPLVWQWRCLQRDRRTQPGDSCTLKEAST